MHVSIHRINFDLIFTITCCIFRHSCNIKLLQFNKLCHFPCLSIKSYSYLLHPQHLPHSDMAQSIHILLMCHQCRFQRVVELPPSYTVFHWQRKTYFTKSVCLGEQDNSTGQLILQMYRVANGETNGERFGETPFR